MALDEKAPVGSRAQVTGIPRLVVLSATGRVLSEDARTVEVLGHGADPIQGYLDLKTAAVQKLSKVQPLTPPYHCSWLTLGGTC